MISNLQTQHYFFKIGFVCQALNVCDDAGNVYALPAIIAPSSNMLKPYGFMNVIKLSITFNIF